MDNTILRKNCEVANEILEILEEEFVALKNQDLEKFDTLQQSKSTLIDFISTQNIPPFDYKVVEDPWLPFREIIQKCQNLHRRNEILITRKLDSIRAALNTLSGDENNSSLEMYDRLGKIAQKRGKQGFIEA